MGSVTRNLPSDSGDGEGRLAVAEEARRREPLVVQQIVGLELAE